jgi:hypothetical protein
MSCVLRAIGTEFDVDAFVKDSQLAGTAFHRGEPRPTGGQRAASGLNVDVAGGFDDLDAQIQAAAHFLLRHEDELRRLASFPGVEEVCLDFGLRTPDRSAMSSVFPADFLWQSGALDIDLVVTHYEVATGVEAGGGEAAS